MFYYEDHMRETFFSKVALTALILLSYKPKKEKNKRGYIDFKVPKWMEDAGLRFIEHQSLWSKFILIFVT